MNPTFSNCFPHQCFWGETACLSVIRVLQESINVQSVKCRQPNIVFLPRQARPAVLKATSSPIFIFCSLDLWHSWSSTSVLLLKSHLITQLSMRSQLFGIGSLELLPVIRSKVSWLWTSNFNVNLFGAELVEHCYLCGRTCQLSSLWPL